jgi:Tol biopolymer transport system component
MQRLTFVGKNRHPIWSRDGRWVAFQSDREGDLAIFRQRADGSGSAERLTKPDAGAEHIPQSFSPGDGYLLFTLAQDKEWTLWTRRATDGQVAPFGDVRSDTLVEGVFSPDGRWVAYQAEDRLGSGTVSLVQPFPATGTRHLIGDAGQVYWSPKGDQLLLNTGSGQSAVIPVTTTPRVTFGRPLDFPRGERREGPPRFTRREADSMPDGEHVIGVMVASGGLPHQINVVLNWFDDVRQRVPGP